MFGLRLTPSRHGRIELFTSIDRHTTLKETLTIAEDWLPLIGKDQKVLYLNSLYCDHDLQQAIAKQFSRRPASEVRRLLTQYIRPDQLNGHLDFFEAVVRDENVKVVILNCFDFAALTPNRQSKLAAFLKILKDVYEVHVVVSVIGMPIHPTGSGKSLLKYIADSQAEAGSYLMAKESPEVTSFMSNISKEEDEEEDLEPLAELPPSPLDFRTNTPNYDLPSFMKNQEPPLKTNNLRLENQEYELTRSR